MAVQVSVVGSGAEHEANAEVVAAAARGARSVAQTPAEAVEFALAAARHTGVT